MRADARKSLDSLLEAAKAVFAELGIDAPVREITTRAGVGLGTFYRHFPQRADLIAAVFRREVDGCAAAAPQLAAKHKPMEALVRWLDHYADFIGTKRGLAAALHSGDPTYDSLPAYFETHLRPAIAALLESAAAAGAIRSDVEPGDLLRAVSNLSVPDRKHTSRMLALLIDGLRYGAAKPTTSKKAARPRAR